jgi:hypothetical protein
LKPATVLPLTVLSLAGGLSPFSCGFPAPAPRIKFRFFELKLVLVGRERLDFYLATQLRFKG